LILLTIQRSALRRLEVAKAAGEKIITRFLVAARKH
jgi:hypothetical protein